MTRPLNAQLKTYGKMVKPFLDNIATPEPNRALSLGVYLHTDQHLHWDSHHHITAKYSVINTLTLRAKAVCFTPEPLRTEQKHV